MMRIAALVLTLLFLGATRAAAQTPEEAVAYLVAGLVDGATVGTSVFKKTADSPATYVASRDKPSEHEPQVTIKVTRKTDCVYEVALAVDQGKGAATRLASLDFSKVKAMDYVGKEKVNVTGADYCKGDIPPACQGRLAVDVLPDKFKQAYADLRKVCH